MKNLARFLGINNEKPAVDNRPNTPGALPMVEDTLEQSMEVHHVAPHAIVPNPYQPRKMFNDESLQELAASIKEYGIIQPLLVRRTAAGLELIAGERRLRASKTLGLETVPVIIRDMDDKEMAELAMIENLQREDLHFLEEALGYQTLIANFGLTQEELARRLGKSQSTIANKLRILKLPGDVQTSVIDDNLTERHARSLLRLSDPERQRYVLAMIVQKELNVRETDNLIDEVLQDISREMEKKKKPGQNMVKVIRDARLFINSITKMTSDIKKSGLNVTIKQEQDDDYVIISLRIPKRK